jgi:hypothetical protein
MPSILALATTTREWWLAIEKWDPRLTIGTVKKQNCIGTAEDGNQSPVHLGCVRLLGGEGDLDVAIVAASTALRRRLCDDLLVERHSAVLRSY